MVISIGFFFRAETMKIGPGITFFLNISNLSKNYLINFFYSVSNFGMVQLKYQTAKRLKFSFLVL